MTSRPEGADDAVRTVAAPVATSLLVLGSKFLAYLAPTLTFDEAQEVLKLRSRRYPDASHHCWACRVERPDILMERTSDAGEPPGTAGRPILDVLRGAHLENIICVVTRYFGGTKLGTGGLVRAYGDAAHAATARASIVTRQIARVVTIDFDHDRTGIVYRALDEFGITLRNGRYDDRAHGTLQVPQSKAGALHDRIVELSRTGVDWAEGDLILQ